MKLSRRVFDSCSVSGSKLAKVQTRALARAANAAPVSELEAIAAVQTAP